MRVRHSKTPIPQSFYRHPHAKGLLGDADIQLTRGSRLRAKLLVFDTPKSLRQFWLKGLGRSDLGRGCLGAVSSLSLECCHFPAKGQKQRPPHIECDPRYFCIIGLCKGHLTMEIICHEAVHAGFSYAKRQMRQMWPNEKECGEEGVCYPSGVIASEITSYCRQKGFLK